MSMEDKSELMQAVGALISEWTMTQPYEDEGIFSGLSCSEVQPLADIFYAAGHDVQARRILESHAYGDYDVEDGHHHLYLALKASNGERLT